MECRQGLELRADGRTLTGAAVTYGDVSETHRERFAPGSLRVSADLAPTLGHRTGRVLAYGADVRLEDRSDAFIVSARLPRTEIADMALEGVKAGRYRGWSVEMRVKRDRRDSQGLRVIESADVPGLALVDHPSYEGSRVETRQARRLMASMPLRKDVDCRCSGPDCASARVEAIDEPAGELLGYLGDYSKPLGRATAKVAGDVVEVSIDMAEGVQYIDDLVAVMRSGVRPIVRPYPDPIRSVSRKVGKVLVYERLVVAGWIASFTDQRGGFESATLADDAGNRRGLVRVAAPSALEAISGGFSMRRLPWL